MVPARMWVGALKLWAGKWGLGLKEHGLGVVEVGQLCLCQLIKTGMLTSFQNKMQLKYSLDGT